MNIIPEASTSIAIDFENREVDGTPCKICHKNTQNISKKKVGWVTVGWCICLFAFTGVLWIYPCCADSCKDTQMTCAECSTVKVVKAANCC